jgi:hypothetical protein
VAPGPVWERKISPPLGLDPRTVQPVAFRYTDYGNSAHTLLLECCKSYGGFMHERDFFYYLSNSGISCTNASVSQSLDVRFSGSPFKGSRIT